MDKRPLDLTVHKRNKKGNITSVTPYRLMVVDGISMYEIPKDSGKFYAADGSPIDKNKLSQQSVQKQNDRLLQEQNDLLREQNAALLRQLNQQGSVSVENDPKDGQDADKLLNRSGEAPKVQVSNSSGSVRQLDQEAQGPAGVQPKDGDKAAANKDNK